MGLGECSPELGGLETATGGSGLGLRYVHADMPAVRRLERDAFSEDELRELKSWLEEAFADPAGSWREEMWSELGDGPHFLIEEDGELVAHACLVFGQVRTGGRELETAFVENVATRADRRRRGLATVAMRVVQAEIMQKADLGVLGTGTPAFYEPLGWERWRGSTSVRESDGTTTNTPEEDGFVFVFRTQRTPPDLDMTAPIQRDRRDADEPW
jgi:aminoglycoside 2'-N-acetyltransferase I